MKKIFTLLSLILVMALYWPLESRGAVSIPKESLRYKVMFKWGLINKKAGWARLDYTPGSVTAQATLYAGSEPWADKIYYLRDTLTSTIRPSSMTPTYYERVANEDGKYSRDIVKFVHEGTRVTAQASRYRRQKPGAELTEAHTSLEAVGATVDMVSAFYYMRTMPFSSMEPGQQRIINIFSAKKKERLTITYVGTAKIDIDGHKYDTYHIKFRFTTDGSKKSSDDIDTWIETAAPHRPVKLEGKLKIGKVMCLLEP
ncbi:MAG: DUF3108 domain-containing protein [Pseudoflavonifractor sp.]|nr:DUF3108 domain-containing protein [Alloprevotella sp.]MCM1116842.1 DUF3108 domain-containing protein [Pseudoflavonifractor sp.]